MTPVQRGGHRRVRVGLAAVLSSPWVRPPFSGVPRASCRPWCGAARRAVAVPPSPSETTRGEGFLTRFGGSRRAPAGLVAPLPGQGRGRGDPHPLEQAAASSPRVTWETWEPSPSAHRPSAGVSSNTRVRPWDAAAGSLLGFCYLF